MSPIKNQLFDVIDCLQEQELTLLYEIAKRFVSDDIATEDDLKTILEAQAEYKNGETVSHSDINWD